MLKPVLGSQLNLGSHLTRGLVGLWLMNEGSGNKVFDLSGNGTFGTFQADTVWASGKFGSATSYDGTGDFIELDNGSTLHITKPSLPITFVAWIYPTDLTVSRGIFMNDSFRADGAGNYYGILLYHLSNGALECHFGDGEGTGTTDRQTLIGSVSLTANAWQQVVCVIRGASDISLYIDAIEDTGGSYSGTGGDIAYSSAKGRIGEGVSNTNFQGLIDHVLIYNRALFATEIAELYRVAFQI